MAVAVDGTGHVLADMPRAVSSKLVVKTQRALNDYRKNEYPHCRDDIKRLKGIGAVTAQRLQDCKTHVGPSVPFTQVSTAEQLRDLLDWAEHHPVVQNKLKELFNMRGKHQHKWEDLKARLAEKMCVDDSMQRLWLAPDGTGGLLYQAKQAAVNFNTPAARIVRALDTSGNIKLQAIPLAEAGSVPAAWRAQAESDWAQPGHRGWQLASALVEPLEWVGSAASMSGAGGSYSQSHLQQLQQQAAANHSARQSYSGAVPQQLQQQPLRQLSIQQQELLYRAASGGLLPGIAAAAAAAAGAGGAPSPLQSQMSLGQGEGFPSVHYEDLASASAAALNTPGLAALTAPMVANRLPNFLAGPSSQVGSFSVPNHLQGGSFVGGQPPGSLGFAAARGVGGGMGQAFRVSDHDTTSSMTSQGTGGSNPLVRDASLASVGHGHDSSILIPGAGVVNGRTVTSGPPGTLGTLGTAMGVPLLGLGPGPSSVAAMQQQLQQQLQQQQAQMQQPQQQAAGRDSSGGGAKRSRQPASAAAFDTAAGVEPAPGEASDPPASQKALYHLESRGRHVPRHRGAEDLAQFSAPTLHPLPAGALDDPTLVAGVNAALQQELPTGAQLPGRSSPFEVAALPGDGTGVLTREFKQSLSLKDADEDEIAALISGVDAEDAALAGYTSAEYMAYFAAADQQPAGDHALAAMGMATATAPEGAMPPPTALAGPSAVPLHMRQYARGDSDSFKKMLPDHLQHHNGEELDRFL